MARTDHERQLRRANFVPFMEDCVTFDKVDAAFTDMPAGAGRVAAYVDKTVFYGSVFLNEDAICTFW